MITFEWLIGTGISIVGIITVIMVYQHGVARRCLNTKTDIKICDERHEKIDKVSDKVDRINDTVIRIEAVLKNREK